jgi:hypothetical protein
MPCSCAIQMIYDGAIIENWTGYYKAFRIGHVPSRKQFECHCHLYLRGQSIGASIVEEARGKLCSGYWPRSNFFVLDYETDDSVFSRSRMKT